MSTNVKGKKRKSGDHVVSAAKKIKTTKSADKPAPLKSAIKKSKIQTIDEDKSKSQSPKAIARAISEPGPDQADVAAAVSADNDDLEDGIDLTADRTAELLAGFSSDSDSDTAERDDGIAITMLPPAPINKPSQDGASADPETSPGVVYISRIPHGFYEKQMRAYFSQFGNISHLRLARNKKTGKSKHHAFVAFESAAVADIVAKTMDKYLLFGHILQCRRVPADQIQEGLWKGGKVQQGKVRPRNRIEGSRLRKGMDREGWEKRVDREEKRRADKQEKLKSLGYEYEMPELKRVGDVPVKPKVIESVDVDADAEVVGGVKQLGGRTTHGESGTESKIEQVAEAQTNASTIVVEQKTVKRKNKGSRTTTTIKKKVKVAA